jgi:hypothetical protein
MTPEEITRRYATEAAKLDTGPYANWFHFATWGTHTIGKIIASAPDSEMAKALWRAEKRIYRSVRAERPFPVEVGFEFYELARENPDSFGELVYYGTTTIAGHEQHLIDDDLREAFAAAPLSATELTSLLTVEFPAETLKLSEDVPGYPGTAATDWRNYDERMRWITAVIAAKQGDPTLHANYHAVLGAALNVRV